MEPPEHVVRSFAFVSIFISFKGALDEVIAGCRSLVGMDKAHLKSIMKVFYSQQLP